MPGETPGNGLWKPGQNLRRDLDAAVALDGMFAR